MQICHVCVCWLITVGVCSFTLRDFFHSRISSWRKNWAVKRESWSWTRLNFKSNVSRTTLLPLEIPRFLPKVSIKTRLYVVWIPLTTFLFFFLSLPVCGRPVNELSKVKGDLEAALKDALSAMRNSQQATPWAEATSIAHLKKLTEVSI